MSLAPWLVIVLLAQAQVPGQPTRTPPRDPRQAPAAGSGTIRGQVVDATSGAPIRRATVTAYGGELRGGRPPSAMSDDDGRFELSELPAGKYTLAVSKSSYVGGGYGPTPVRPPAPIELADKQVVDKVVLRLARGGVVIGRVMDEAGEPAIGVELRAMQYRYGPNGRTLDTAPVSGFFRTDDLGAFRLYGLPPGQYYIAARPDTFMMGLQPADTGPITTYFPNSPEPATAQRVTVAAGRETGPVIITLVSTKLARVRGRAIMSNGQPFVNAQVSVNVRDINGSSSRGGGQTAGDGTFELRGLAAGTYELEVRPPRFGPTEDDSEVGRQTITVAGDDVDGVLVVGAKPGIVRGRVMTDDGSPFPFTNLNVMAQAPGPGVRFFSPPGVVKEDHTFELRGLFGQRLFRMGGMGPPVPNAAPWMLKAVLLDGVDIIDKPIDIPPGAVIEGLEMIFTQKAAELSGTVTISGEAKLEDAWIILFPGDESLWRDTMRFVRIARPDKDGTYRFRMLPAHNDYLLVTALQIEPGQYMDPDFLKSVRDRAMRVSLNEGEKRVQNIRIAPIAQ